VQDVRAYLIFFLFSSLYVVLAWVVSGGDTWWVVDFVDGQNVFFGDDAYRFFLSRGAWVNPDLYTYNFVLPGQLFLDGAITNLVNGDLFLSRCVHGLVGAAGLSLLYLSGRQLDISKTPLLAAIMVMGFLPRYALMSLSFYGEVWLGFFLILALFLFLKKNLLWMSLVASCFPLLRPEGIFFLAPLCLYMVMERRPKEFFLMLLPGFLYFIFVYFSLASLSDYSYWRTELRTILSKMDHLTGNWDLFFIYSALFTVPAALALFSSSTRKFWPFLVGAGLWVLWFQFLVINQLATFENRYSYALIPFIAILWAIFFNGVSRVASRYMTGQWISVSQRVLVFAIALSIILLHFAKTSNVRQVVRDYGYSGLMEKIMHGRWEEIYGFHPRETLEARKDTVATIEALLVQDKGIDNLSIYTNTLFYYLDPEKIPQHVTVGFLTNGYMVFQLLLDGQSFIQHSGGRMYSYMDYGEPDFRDGEKRAIVVTVMPLENYPYTWKRNGIEMYLFSYLKSDHARVDISERPKITPQILQDAYSPWYGK